MCASTVSDCEDHVAPRTGYGAPGLEAAIAALWPTLPLQRCTVHKERNLLAHAPKRMHEEIKADYSAMM